MPEITVSEAGKQLTLHAKGTGMPAWSVYALFAPVVLASVSFLGYYVVRYEGLLPVALSAAVLAASVWFAWYLLDRNDVGYLFDQESGVVLRKGRTLLPLSDVEAFGTSLEEYEDGSYYALAARTATRTVKLGEIRSPFHNGANVSATSEDAERIAVIARRVASFTGKPYAPKMKARSGA